ncbi:MAG: GNAT family N-acetyltransferase [Candidatus Carbobacillus altaicus]|uniref:Ribosomal-protein-L7p-serine acetyltransferase n=1 Tax=Candidatus Carbonibacillus altaicus TaxID=2163959 RepID=A0A2R6XZS2_9BACL|nr:GNAT family N-acetyltransferase [Candidatus Carbobacillus altaicus]PTQ55928.1 MAG: Ribosomal-protein-L7p-serine acetyltransferase [Candidatus Carbobacillus altaicus]
MFELTADYYLRLKPLAYRDVPSLYRLIDTYRTDLSVYLPWVRKQTIQDTYAFVDFSIGQERRREGFQAGLFYMGALVGVIGYHKIDWENHKTSLGYWLAPPYQGKGLMTKAAQAMVDYAFFEYRLNRLEIRAATENWPSRKVAERLGFTYEGTLREAEWLGDRYVDHAVYGLIRREWLKRQDDQKRKDRHHDFFTQ